MADAQSRAAAHAEPGPCWDEVRGRLDEALAHLGNGTRAAVIGHYLEGLPQAAVASRLGISEEAARKRLQSAREQLRRWFARRGLTVGAGALAAGLASEAPAAEPLLVHSCVQAGLHPSGAAAALAASGGGALSTAAIAAVLCGMLAAGSALYAVLSPRVQAGDPPPAPAAQAEQPGPLLARQLAARIDVMYRRDLLGEVLTDLKRQVGIEVAVPNVLFPNASFSYEARHVTVREVLERLASEQGLRLAYHQDTAALWKPAADGVITSLTERLQHGNLGERLEAAFDLGQLADPRIYPPLFAALKDPEPSVVRKVMIVLERDADCVRCQTLAPVPTAELMRMCTEPELPGINPNTKQAIAILGHSRIPATTAWLLSFLEHCPRELRNDVIDALASTRDPQAFPLFRSMLNNPDLSEPERDQAGLAMCRAGDVTEAVVYVRSRLQKDGLNDELLRGMAQLDGPHIFDAVAQLPFDSEQGQRAIRIFQWNRDPRAAPLLMQQLQGNDSRTRNFAAQALCEFRDPQISQQVWSLLNSTSDRFLREICAALLASQRDLRIVPDLMRLVDSVGSDNVHTAVMMLSHLRDAAITRDLYARFFRSADGQFPMFMSAYEWNDPQIANMVETQRRSRHQRNRETALMLIRRFAPREAVLSILGSEDPEQRYVAARRLVLAGDPRGLQPLIALVHDTTAPYYGGLFRALCDSEDTRAEDALLVMLEDRHVGSTGLNSDKTILTNRPRIRQRLVQLLSDSRSDVRISVALSLIHIGTCEIATALVKHLQPADWATFSDVNTRGRLEPFLATYPEAKARHAAAIAAAKMAPPAEAAPATADF